MNRFDGFHEFVVARGGALSRTAFLLTGEHHAAEDLVQSALAKAAARWRQLMEYGQPEAYIRRIMINEHISWWRRRPARPMAQVPEWAGPDEPRQVVDRVVLGRALDTLAPRQRAVIVLRYYEDLTEAETAAAMGCSIGTVKSQAHAALGKLRVALPMFAEQAGQYADAEAAVVQARRSRVRRVAVGAALAVLPLSLVAVLFAVRGGDTVPPPLTGTPSPSPSALVPVLPTPVPGVGAAVPELPRDRGVGPASLVRFHRDGTGGGRYPIDVLAGGAWYRLSIPRREITSDPGLSPDGRWLAWNSMDGFVVRDLTGTGERAVPGVRLVGWSPSGNWMLGTRSEPGRIRHTIFAASDWTETLAPPPVRGWNIRGVLDTGELLRGGGVEGDAVLVEVVDPRSGTIRRVSLDPGESLRAGESVRKMTGGENEFGPHQTELDNTTDGSVALPVWDGMLPVAYLRFSLADGRLLQRQEFPPLEGPKDRRSRYCQRGAELIWQREGALIIQPRAGGAATVPLPPGRHLLPGCSSVL